MGTLTEMLKQQGPSLCIDDLAAAWGDQTAMSGHLDAIAKRNWVLGELQEAINGGAVQIFDTVGNRERSYRLRDAPALERHRVRMLPQSFNAWLEKQGQPLLLNAPLLGASQNSQSIKPVPRQEAQDLELLAKLRELGFDPAALPPIQPGLPGPKAAASEALGSNGIWSGSTVFNKTWERLTKNKEIQYRSSSS
ncbi:hypothetical protein ACIPIN_12760 [Pseudomonas sp. NPDC087697]|uniref:hypothetical protein n=1 Tax=Pseudomonas sp. NPDC087697 TaxID=3364447 RepID=UPI00380B189E